MAECLENPGVEEAELPGALPALEAKGSGYAVLDANSVGVWSEVGGSTKEADNLKATGCLEEAPGAGMARVRCHLAHSDPFRVLSIFAC